jgi:hypothetical protein
MGAVAGWLRANQNAREATTKAASAQRLAQRRFPVSVLAGALAAPSLPEPSPPGAASPAGKAEAGELELPEAELEGDGSEMLALPEPPLVALPLGRGLLSSFELLSGPKRVLPCSCCPTEGYAHSMVTVFTQKEQSIQRGTAQLLGVSSSFCMRLSRLVDVSQELVRQS